MLTMTNTTKLGHACYLDDISTLQVQTLIQAPTLTMEPNDGTPILSSDL